MQFGVSAWRGYLYTRYPQCLTSKSRIRAYELDVSAESHRWCSLQYVHVWLSIIQGQLIVRLYSCHQAAAHILLSNLRRSARRQTLGWSWKCALHGVCGLSLRALWAKSCKVLVVTLIYCSLHLLYCNFVWKLWGEKNKTMREIFLRLPHPVCWVLLDKGQYCSLLFSYNIPLLSRTCITHIGWSDISITFRLDSVYPYLSGSWMCYCCEECVWKGFMRSSSIYICSNQTRV